MCTQNFYSSETYEERTASEKVTVYEEFNSILRDDSETESAFFAAAQPPLYR